LNWIDKKGRLFGKINVIDCCVVIVILLLAAGAFYKFHGLSKTSTNAVMQPVRYTIEVKRIRDYIHQNVREGDTLFDKTSGNPIGTITKIESTPAKENVLCIDGEIRPGTVENRIDVILTIEANAVVSDKGVFVNRTYELNSNSERGIMTKYFECSGRILDIVK